jgi:hypothetical protein
VIKRLTFLAILGLIVGLVYAGQIIDETRTALFETTTAGDTAMVIAFTVSQGLDSHDYLDTFVTGSGAEDSTVAKWTSPLQTMIFALAGNTASPTKLDTAGIGVVGCTAVFAAQELGIEYDLSSGADSTIETAVDSIVDIWNKRTNLKDSIVAQDSVTYVKLVSKFGQAKFTARWSIKMTTDSTDTAGAITTVGMVCDSMNAAINAALSAVLSSVIHATEDSFLVTSDDPGLPFTVYFGDSISDNGDTVHGQLNVTSYSGKTDTIKNLVGLIRSDGNLYPEIIRIVLKPCTTTAQGLGLSDSGYLWLWTVFADEYHLLKADTCAELPCTLRLPYASVDDSLFKQKLALGWRIADTTSDSVMIVLEYDIDVNYTLGRK